MSIFLYMFGGADVTLALNQYVCMPGVKVSDG